MGIMLFMFVDSCCLKMFVFFNGFLVNLFKCLKEGDFIVVIEFVVVCVDIWLVDSYLFYVIVVRSLG